MRNKLHHFCQTHRRQLRLAGIVLCLGLLYYLLTQLTSFRIPCLLQKVTGFACPGCGISHFCIRLLHLDFMGAARENQAVAFLLPLWLAALLLHLFLHPKWLQKNSRCTNLLLWGSIVILIGFGIIRNLPGMEFLLPTYYSKGSSILFDIFR